LSHFHLLCDLEWTRMIMAGFKGYGKMGFFCRLHIKNKLINGEALCCRDVKTAVSKKGSIDMWPRR
ncbi:MAG: hypothetical protein COA36_05280, partial [Desulfotalea sp.]